MATHKRTNRRGVILLVLLGMLALFGATAFAFVVIASHADRSAKSLQRVGRVSYSPADDLDEAMRQALRGTNNLHSVLRYHSLLGDIYGTSHPIHGGAHLYGWVINGYAVAPSNGKGVAANLLPGTATAPSSHQSSVGGDQIIEFTVGFTIPQNEQNGGLHPPGTANEGQPVTSTGHVPYTVTIPVWYGTQPQNGAANNDPVEFRRRVGCVLTITDPSSALYGKSTRIIGYRRQPFPASGAPGVIYHRYQVLPFEDVSVADTLSYLYNTNSSSPNFVINGTPFSGFGAGYDPTSGDMDAAYPERNHPIAFLPNPTEPRYDSPANAHSANEDYDAPDYQNMLLAFEQWDGTAMALTRSPSLHRPALANYWIHELAREMVDVGIAPANAWRAIVQPYGKDGIRATGDEAVPTWQDLLATTKRRCLLRPLPLDHPNFDGGNSNWPTYIGENIGSNIAQLQEKAKRAWGAVDLRPGATAPWFSDTNGDGIPDQEIIPWDVDNDGDGLPDSIWVDLGLPIRTLPDGRKYKPLVAIRCVDLDGRINLNAVGSLEQLTSEYRGPVAPSGYWNGPSGALVDGVAYSQDVVRDPGNNTRTLNPIDMARGQGTGAPEINALDVLNSNGQYYRNLLLGSLAGLPGPGKNYDGRYGELAKRDSGNVEFHEPAPGVTGALGPADQLCTYQLFGYPANYFTGVGTSTGTFRYGSPVDLKGTMAVGLDFFGQPIYSTLRGVPAATRVAFGWNAAAWNMARNDTPYELRLGRLAAQNIERDAGQDNAFTVAELEAVLRRNDPDRHRLPPRLRDLLASDVSTSLHRYQVTTESWDPPVPSLAMTDSMRQAWLAYAGNNNLPRHLTDLIAAKVEELNSRESGASIFPAGSRHRFPMPYAIDMSQLLSRDLLADLRMDLNRPFGNGRDDDGNGVVDEPGERLELARRVPGSPTPQQLEAGFERLFFGTDSARFNHDNDNAEGFPGATALREHLESDSVHDRIYSYRQRFARHLYVLAMALVEEDWYPWWDQQILQLAGAPTREQQRVAKARALAQWAINVVDFIDRDSVMTPFEYDVYPFSNRFPEDTTNPPNPVPREQFPLPGAQLNTWSVDGDITTSEPTSGFVWGCERPELLITETMAFHDRRTRDTNGDDKFEQTHRPEGSLFVELYNPWSASEPGPGEFYRNKETDTDTAGVRLDQKTSAQHGYPVWRLAVAQVDLDSRGFAQPPDAGRSFIDPDDATLTSPPTIDRLVYFVPDNYAAGDPSTTRELPEKASVYTCYSPSVDAYDNLPGGYYTPVLPNRYAIIGPGNHVGAAVDGTTLIGAAPENPGDDVSSKRRIVLNPGAAPEVVVDMDGDGANDLDLGRSIHNPTAVVIDAPWRMSISEPPGGYEADDPASPYAPYSQKDGYQNGPISTPEDITRNDTEFPWGGDHTADPPVPGDGVLAVDGTAPVIRYVHLQRLADPTRPYDVDRNPYLTIDSAGVDLSVFNGLGGTGDQYVSAGGTYHFNSRQRGEDLQNLPGTVGAAGLWRTLLPDSTMPPTSNNPTSYAGGDGEQRFGAEPLGETFGYLNEWYGTPLDPRPVSAGGFELPTRYRGAPEEVGGGGAPDTFEADPFPWLTWLNRPLANPLELMHVPATRSSRLLTSYENDEATQAAPLQQFTAGQESYRHLMPFFATLDGTTTPSSGKTRGHSVVFSGAPPTLTCTPPHLYRLLDYLRVPSWFLDANVHGNPGNLVDAALVGPGPSHLAVGIHDFHPPFHRIPQYREPGRVNVNTIFHQNVWNGIANDDVDLAAQWADFLDARRGYAAVNDGDLEAPGGTDVPLPTRFANPVRSFAAASRVPTIPGRPGIEAGGTLPNLQEIVKALNDSSIPAGLNSTLMRTAMGNILSDASVAPLITNAHGNEDFRDTDKNPYFRYQSLQRLSNLVTTRSNVYAVWITVGYFEVEKQANFNAAAQSHIYPSGYTLGQELGIDTGNIQRHRAFYIIDRSIPVGFVPGQDLNTEKAVLLRRFIE